MEVGSHPEVFEEGGVGVGYFSVGSVDVVFVEVGEVLVGEEESCEGCDVTHALGDQGDDCDVIR